LYTPAAVLTAPDETLTRRMRLLLASMTSSDVPAASMATAVGLLNSARRPCAASA
jgi:hypothetical protein